jgi:uncharacterized membrane protein
MHRWGKPSHYRRRRIWFIPSLWILLALAGSVVLARANLAHFDISIPAGITPTVVVPVLTSISSGMMALTGIVFSLAFVFVQFGSSAYSPRLVTFFTTDRVMLNALGIFTGTFLFALTGLLLMTPERPPVLDWLVAAASLLWLLASAILFILLIGRINHLTISNVLHMVGEQGRQVIDDMYAPIAPSDTAPKDGGDRTASAQAAELPSTTQTLRYYGGPAVILELKTGILVELARVADAVIEVKYAVGDVVTDGSAVLHVRGGKHELPEAALRRAIALGFERTIEQDPKYALRLLVDVGIKALSPAVNDPTTAVMALNEISDLLERIGQRQLEMRRLAGAHGALRLICPTPTWEDFVSLGLDEIRYYGANSFQVMRRLRALLIDLEPAVPAERRAAIRQALLRTEAAVSRSFVDAWDLQEAQQVDRQGIGLSRPVEKVPATPDPSLPGRRTIQ